MRCRALLLGIAAATLCLLSGCTSTSGSVLPVTGGPPVGKYNCWAGGFQRLSSGSFTILPKGDYIGMADRRGRYIYEPAEKKIVFTTGDYEFWDFVAIYQSSADSDVGRERLVLKDESAPSPIGKERPGEYHYCYREESTRTAQDASNIEAQPGQ